MGRRELALITVAALSGGVTLVLRRTVLADATWWPLVMIALLTATLGLLWLRQR
jgi:hypothetical protein